MSTVLAMAVPAIALSALAALALALLPNAPPRVRLAISVAGLAAWLTPWPWLEGVVELPARGGVAPLVQSFVRIVVLDGRLAVDAPSAAPHSLAYVLSALLAVGLVLLARDSRALRRTLRRWRRGSRSGEALRALLPPELRGTRVEIRVVRGERVAAASGWLAPTIWIGEEYTGSDLELVLVHEVCHVRRSDPLWISLLVVVQRLYWWNPLVAHLVGQASLMLESACDHRCASVLGKRRYIGQLAALMPAAGDPASPRLVATMHFASANVRRLAALRATPRLRARDGAVLALLTLGGATTALAHVLVDPSFARGPVADHLPTARPAWSRVAIPETPAGRALANLLGALNGGDAYPLVDYLDAFTPQERELPLTEWPNGVELVAILGSEPRRVEYVVEDARSGSRRGGLLEIDTDYAPRLTDLGALER